MNVKFTTEEQEGLLAIPQLKHRQSIADSYSDHTYESLSIKSTHSNLSHRSSSYWDSRSSNSWSNWIAMLFKKQYMYLGKISKRYVWYLFDSDRSLRSHNVCLSFVMVKSSLLLLSLRTLSRTWDCWNLKYCLFFFTNYF